MTATPHSTLVERVAEAMRQHEHMICGVPFRSILPIQEARGLAEAALTACHFEEMLEALRDLLQDTQHRDHNCVDAPENCPVLRGRALLAKMDGIA